MTAIAATDCSSYVSTFGLLLNCKLIILRMDLNIEITQDAKHLETLNSNLKRFPNLHLH